MDDLPYLGKLQQEQQKVIQDNEATQESRHKMRDDYLKLQDKLLKLPDTVTSPTMVPIGEVGFFPGKLIHTNEIMVLLGDNWFAERSAKQASGIVDRRIKLIDEQLKELQKEHENIKSHFQYAEYFNKMKVEHDNDVEDIKENLPDNYEAQNKGKSRKAHVPKHNLVQRTVKFKPVDELVENLSKDLHAGDNSDSTINHQELLDRLNELEREEQEEEARTHQEEMKKILKGHEDNTDTDHGTMKFHQSNNKEDLDTNEKAGLVTSPGSSSKRHVKFNDFHNQDSGNVYFDSPEFDGDKENSAFDNDGDNVIRFSHTSQITRGRSASESDIIKQNVNSPADIYEHFLTARQDNDDRPLKSILKKDSRSNSNENLKLRPILKTSPEHRPGTPEHTLDDPKPILKTPPDTQGSDRRPGTPEYVIDDEPKPILKTHDHSDHRHRNPEVQFANNASVMPEFHTDDTRSILKTDSVLSDDEQQRGVHPKTILKSPEVSRNRKIADEFVERKPILKHYGAEAFSGKIVERDVASSFTSTADKESNKEKPMSRFKASRLKK